MNPSNLSIVASEGHTDATTTTAVVTISTSSYELNISFRLDEIQQLPRAKAARSADDDSVELGRCGNTPVFWSTTDDHINVFVGGDDHTPDFGIRLPIWALDAVIDELEFLGLGLPANSP